MMLCHFFVHVPRSEGRPFCLLFAFQVVKSTFRGTPVAIKNVWAPYGQENADLGTNKFVGGFNATAAEGTTSANGTAGALDGWSMDEIHSNQKHSSKLRVLAAMCGGALWVKANEKRQLYNMYRDMRIVSKIRSAEDYP